MELMRHESAHGNGDGMVWAYSALALLEIFLRMYMQIFY